MKLWKNISVAYKVALVVAVAAIASILIAVSGIQGILSSSSQIKLLKEESITRLAKLTQIVVAIQDVNTGIRSVCASSGAQADKAAREADNAIAEVNAFTQEYLKACPNPDDREAIDAFSSEGESFFKAWAARRKMFDELDTLDAIKLYDRDLKPIWVGRVMPAIVKVRDANEKEAKETTEAALAANKSAVGMVSIVLIISFVAVVIFFTIAIRSIRQPIAAVEKGLEAMDAQCAVRLTEGLTFLADGNLTASAAFTLEPLDYVSTDELGRMTACYNRMLSRFTAAAMAYEHARLNLIDLVQRCQVLSHEVQDRSQNIAAAAQECTASATELAAGGERLANIAGNATEVTRRTSTSIDLVATGSEREQEQLAKAHHQLVEVAEEVVAMQSASGAMESSAKSGFVAVSASLQLIDDVKVQVAKATDQVQQMALQTKEVANIVDTIRQIADQTNLLALNAAVEAARAGDHGRGFAVVADEVRKLAEEAASATTRVSRVISTTVATVNDTVTTITQTSETAGAATEQSAQAGIALEAIIEAAEEVQKASRSVASGNDQAVRDMTAATESATANLEETLSMRARAAQVLKMVEEVDDTSQQTAAATEELTATTEEFASAAAELTRISDELNELMTQFRTEDKPTSTVRLRKAA